MELRGLSVLRIHCGSWFLFTTVQLVLSWSTFCPVISPIDELVYFTEAPSKLFYPVTKSQCALECASSAAQAPYADGGAVCRGFNYNVTSSNCSIFNYEPMEYAVDLTGFTAAYQVSDFITVNI
jgi:hypothetical protein